MAARFWIGGTGNWDGVDTTHWSGTTGGSGGASAPGSSDTVTLDGSSGGGTVTVTASVNVSSITGGAFTGTFNTNGQSIQCAAFSFSGTGVRTLTLGSSIITCTGTGTAWDCGTATNLTLNANTSQITLSGSGGTTTFQGGSKTYNNVSSTGGVSFFVIGGANTFNNLTKTNSTDQRAGLQFQAVQTISGTFTVTGNSVANRIIINSSTNGAARTLTAAAVSLTNVDLRDITGAGAATWSGTSVGNGGGNSNITFTTPVTRFWVGNGGNWSDTTHWSTSTGGSSGASVPLLHDTVTFDSNSITSGSQTITVDQARFPGCDFTNVLNSPTFTNSVSGGTGQEIYGSIILKAGMSVSGTNQLALISYNTASSVTCSSITLTMPLVPAPIGSGSVTFTDNFYSSSIVTFNSGTNNVNGSLQCTTMTLTAGTLTISGDVICNLFVSSNTNSRTLNMGSGNWYIASSGTVWSTSTTTNLTFNANTSKIILTDTSSTDKTFAGGGLTFNNLKIMSSGSGKIIFTGANTFNIMEIYAPKTVQFTSSTTNTIGTLIATGSSGNVITITSTSAGVAATLNNNGMNNWYCDWLSLQDITGTGTGKFAGANTTNVSGNTGWIFSPTLGTPEIAQEQGMRRGVKIW